MEVSFCLLRAFARQRPQGWMVKPPDSAGRRPRAGWRKAELVGETPRLARCGGVDGRIDLEQSAAGEQYLAEG